MEIWKEGKRKKEKIKYPLDLAISLSSASTYRAISVEWLGKSQNTEEIKIAKVDYF